MGCASFEKPKKKHRKGLWSPDEDKKLRDYIQKYGHGCWSSVPMNAGLLRNGKSCRLRWINYLRPGLKRGAFSIAEEDTIFKLHKILGNKWSQIAHHLPGRSDNEIKNYWHSYLKKRVAKMAETEVEAISNECIKGQIQELEIESSTSAMRSIPLFESVDHIKSSRDENLSLPKVLFAEWLSCLDQEYLGSNVVDFKNVNVDNHTSTLIDGMETNIYVDDMLPSTFKLDCQIPINYFPGEFHMYT